MSLTSTFTTKTGDVTVTIDTTESGVFDVTEMGKIEYDFDLTNQGDAVSKVGVLYNRSSLNVYRYTLGGGDMYDILYNELYSVRPASQPIPVTVSINLHSGESAVFKFNIKKRSLYRKINERSMKIDLDPLDDPTTTVADIFTFDITAATKGFDTTNGLTADSFGLLVGNFIEYTISGLNPTLPSFVESAYQGTAGLPSVTFPRIQTIAELVNGTEYLFVAEGTASAELATSAVRNYAVLEGGIFGTGFDSNFYVHRMRTDRNVVFFDTDLESCESEAIPTPYAGIALTMDGYSGDIFNNITVTTQSQSTGVFAEKTVSGIFPMTGCGKGDWDSGIFKMNTMFVSTNDSESMVIASGILAHRTALNASPDPIFKIKMSIYGVDSFKPYETITLSGTTFPTHFRFSPSNARRYYRPTYISYDLHQDKIEVKLYAIV